jgi:glyoxylase-like metal-dependent hydrolase (beta-lactamase superfamily II)
VNNNLGKSSALTLTPHITILDFIKGSLRALLRIIKEPAAGVAGPRVPHPIRADRSRDMDRLIEIKQDMTGFNPFFGSWLCRDGLNILVDVGPASTAHKLIESLSLLHLDRVDYIFITHIHLDHAGALASILEHYPEARAVCHADAIKHLVDPERLWASSLKVLGDIARLYGPPKPVDRNRLIPHTEIGLKDLQVIETPGHALHHLSYSYRDTLYAGEAAGNYLNFDSLDYLRPATPATFFLDVFLESLDLLSKLKDQPIRYAHFGEAGSSHEMVNRFRDQIGRWEEILAESVRRGGTDHEIATRSVELLLDNDLNLAAFYTMDPTVQWREQIFIANSVNGFIKYLNKSY